MDSGFEERILPSIRRSQILLIYRNGRLDNLETCGQIACSVEVIRRMETFGQVACTVRRPARSVFCNAESAERNVCRCRARLRAPWILGWKNVYCPQSADYKYYWFTATAEWTTEVHSALRELNLLRLRSGNLGRYLPLPALVSPRLCRVSTNLHNKQLLG